jgi:dTDP-4-amino-4,6-dideoxygalactose transaminase
MRRQLPVYSPLSLGALIGGAAAMLRPGAEDELAAGLRERWAGADVLRTASGTGALTLALGAAARRAPGPVALPAYACYDLATAADGARASVLLYDVDPGTLGPDFPSLERALAAGARTVVAVHLYGVPVDLAHVTELARRYGAIVIEDAAQAAGTTIGGRPAGTIGPLGILSFGRGKGITGGSGGALLGNDELGRAIVREVAGALGPGRTSAREVVATAAQWLLGRPMLYALPASLPFLGLGETRYRAAEPVRGPSRFSAGVLRRTLELADEEAAVRRTSAERIMRILPRGLHVPGSPVGRAGYLRLPIVADDVWTRRLGGSQARRLGILAGYPAALADLAGFGPRAGNAGDGFEGARRLALHLFTAPTHSRLSAADFARLARLFSFPVPRPS